MMRFPLWQTTLLTTSFVLSLFQATAQTVSVFPTQGDPQRSFLSVKGDRIVTLLYRNETPSITFITTLGRNGKPLYKALELRPTDSRIPFVAVTGADLNPDGKHLALLLLDRVQVLNLLSGDVQFTIPAYGYQSSNGSHSGVIYSSTGRLAWIGASTPQPIGNTRITLNLKNNKQVKTLAFDGSPQGADLAWSTNGRYLLVGSQKSPSGNGVQATLVDVNQHKVVWTTFIRADCLRLEGVSITPDGLRFAVTCSGRDAPSNRSTYHAHVLSLEKRQELFTLKNVSFVRFRRDDSMVTGHTTFISVYNSAGKRIFQKPVPGDAAPVKFTLTRDETGLFLLGFNPFVLAERFLPPLVTKR